MNASGTIGAAVLPQALTAAVQGFAALCLAIGAWTFLLSLANSLWLLRTRLVRPLAEGPRISVLVPARDEAGRIERCVQSLLSQNYGDYEVLVYDDDSKDGTGEILDRLAARESERAAASPEGPPPRLRVIHGAGLESGWYGKPRAMQALSEAATGAYLLFTDADTVHGPQSIGKALALSLSHRAGLVSGYVLHETPDFGRTIVVPAIYLLTMLAMPLPLIHRTRSPALSHAIGQFMFFETGTYRGLGGYAAVKNQVSEDVRIARLVKGSGARVLFADLKDQVSCAMYEDYRSAVDGIAKNVYDYVDKRFSLLFLATLAVPLFAFLPLIGALWLPPGLEAARDLCRLDLLACLAAWTIVALERRLPWYTPLASPLVLASALSAAWRAQHLFGQGKALVWKGRMVK